MSLKCEIINFYKYGAKYGKTHADGTTVRKGYNRVMGGISNVRTFLDKENNVIKYIHKYKDGLDHVTVVHATPTHRPNLYDIVQRSYEKHTCYNAIIELSYIGKITKDFLLGPDWKLVEAKPNEITVYKIHKQL